MLHSIGGIAICAQILFLCGMALVSHKVGFGLKQERRSVMALGIGTRNIAAVFAVLTAIPKPDSLLVVLVVPLSAIVAFTLAGVFAKQAGGTGMEH
jgi:hypothetical protein